MVDELHACPSCGKRAGELKKSELGARFPHYAKCSAWFMTEFMKLPGIAVKLWNEAKVKGKTKRQR